MLVSVGSELATDKASVVCPVQDPNEVLQMEKINHLGFHENGAS